MNILLTLAPSDIKYSLDRVLIAIQASEFLTRYFTNGSVIVLIRLGSLIVLSDHIINFVFVNFDKKKAA